MARWLMAASLVLAAPAWAQSASWHVIEDPARHVCYRVTSLPASGEWRDHGPFNTFRQAGAWEWSNRAICRTMGS